MFCPRCDSPVPDGANFCMRCGNSMSRERVAPAAQPASAAVAPIVGPLTAPVRNSQATPYVVMALVIMVIFLLGWGVSNALQVKGTTDPMLEVKHANKKDLMATAQALPGMPPSVHDWLEHLRRIEERKNRLTAEQVAALKTFAAKYQALGPAAGMLANPDSDDDNTNPVTPMVQTTADMAGPWNKLIKDFQAVPPPPECQKLADEYYSAINEIPAEMNDIQGLLNNLSNQMSNGTSSTGETDANKDALKNAESMQGKSKEGIDDHLTASDDMLGDVCAKYNTRKWFSISSDFGGGLLSTPY
jgi:hypothetical protein